jgi:hypothetical protein
MKNTSTLAIAQVLLLGAVLGCQDRDLGDARSAGLTFAVDGGSFGTPPGATPQPQPPAPPPAPPPPGSFGTPPGATPPPTFGPPTDAGAPAACDPRTSPVPCRLCRVDSDCKLFEDHCFGCQCQAIASDDREPAVCTGQSACGQQACGGKAAVCVNKLCTVR